MVKTIILQGIPGSGKSTYIEKVLSEKYQHYLVVSADHFWLKNGTYKFDVSRLGEAHMECRRRFLSAHNDASKFPKWNVEVIIVDNTNTTLLEMAYYHDLGSLHGPVEIHRIKAPIEAGDRNVHNVPRSSIINMATRIQNCEIPRYWNAKIVDVESKNGFFIVGNNNYDLTTKSEEVKSD